MAITFYATNNFTGDGSNTVWNINFADGYLDSSDVKARYLADTGDYVDIAVTSVAGNVVTITPAQPAGRVFQIYRDTEKAHPLVDFTDGAILNELSLDTLARQAVMVSAEAFDRSTDATAIAGNAYNVANAIDGKAQEALDNSEAAVATANSIAGTAEDALTTAQAAVSTANAASSTANAIAGTANQALTNSNTAISTANAATTTANSAAATANSIDGKATTALNTADSAVSTANTASSKADTAISTANSAVATANAIDGKAQSALDNVAALDLVTMKKSANLSDIADKAAAWLNVRPVGSTPLAADPVNPLDAATKQWVESLRSVKDSWSAVTTVATAPSSGTVVRGGTVKSDYVIGTTSTYQAYIQAYGKIGGVASEQGAVVSNGVQEWTFNQAGTLYFPSAEIQIGTLRPDGALHINAYLRPKDVAVQPLSSVGVAASERNAIRMVNYTDVPEGGYVTSVSGDWYDGTWVLGGVRSGTTALDRAQLNVVSGTGNSASYLFGSDGIARCSEWRSTSDERIKSSIERISNPLSKMRNIKGVTWVLETNGSTGYGFIAQDVEKDFPEAVSETRFAQVTLRDGSILDNVKSVNTSGVAAALHHEAILALMGKVEALEARIAELTSK